MVMRTPEVEKWKSIEVFCCYARQDQLLLLELKKHLMPLQREGLITLWADIDIDAGTEWEKEIHRHLNTARVILLLISPDFMASEYCYSVEMRRAVERHENGEASVIPIILRPVFWQKTPFGKFQALPTNANPIISGKWHYQDEAFYEVVEGIRDVVEVRLAAEAEQARLADEAEQARLAEKERVRLAEDQVVHTEVHSLDQSEEDTTGPSPFLHLEKGDKIEEAAASISSIPSDDAGEALSKENKNISMSHGALLAETFGEAYQSIQELPTEQMTKPEIEPGQFLQVTKIPPKKLFSRRAVITGVAGLAIGGGGLAWLLTSHSNSPGSSSPPGSFPYTYSGHTDIVYAVAWSPSSQRIASGSKDKTVQVWDAADGGHVITYQKHSYWVDAVTWSPNGKRIVSGSQDETVQVWDAANGDHFITKQAPSPVNAVAWSPDGTHIAAGGFNGAMQVWDAADDSHIYTYGGHTVDVNAVAWSPDSKRIASGSTDYTVQVWDAADGGHVITYQKHSYWVLAVAWSPDGQYIASGSADKTVQVWDATNGNHVFTYQKHGDSVNAVAWSPDSKRIASGSTDKTVQVWDATNGDLVFTYRRHDNSVNAVAWSPNGKYIASGSADKTVQVWQAL